MKTATLLSIALGLAAGIIYGDECRRRKYAEGYSADLTKFLHKHSESRTQSEHYPNPRPATSATSH